jgi:hypothetical protein
MKRFILMSMVIITMASGCGVSYNAKKKELLKTAVPSDYGPPPPANSCEIQKQFISNLLKDPQIAQFKCGDNAIKEIIQDGSGSPNPILVWIQLEQVNGKNSYGGYTGFKPYLFAWRDGKIYAVAYPNERGKTGFWKYYGK